MRTLSKNTRKILGPPTGNPVFSNNTDLNYYKLGFVFAKITK